jgi:hypothetical protein
MKTRNWFSDNIAIDMLLKNENIPVDCKTPDSCMFQAELDNCKPTCPIFQKNECPEPDEIMELFPDWDETIEFIGKYRR